MNNSSVTSGGGANARAVAASQLFTEVHSRLSRSNSGPRAANGPPLSCTICLASSTEPWSRNVTVKGGHAEVIRTLGPNPGEQTVMASAPDLPGAPRVTFTTMAGPR